MRGVGTDAGYDAGFDALEVWNGRNVGPRAKVIDDWRALLRTGHPVTPTADTDTHGIVGQEAGLPAHLRARRATTRTSSAWDASRTADLVRGVKVLRDVVLTNGPMLRVTANGAPIGGVAQGPARDGEGARRVRAVGRRRHGARRAGERRRRRGPRDDADREARRDARAAPMAADVDVPGRASSGRRGLRRGERLEADDAGARAATRRSIAPWAMTGAIWVDADGDGKALGTGDGEA